MRTSNQKDRLAKLKQGEGTFTYIGGAFDTESVPGVPLLGPDGTQVRTVPVMEVEQEDGTKVQVADPKAGKKGVLVWKKAPVFKRTELSVFKLRLPGVAAEHVEQGEVEFNGKRHPVRLPSLTAIPDSSGKSKPLYIEFPKGVPVFVGEPRLALKLRCFGFMKEVDAKPEEAPVVEKSEPKKTKGEKSAA